MDDMNTSVAETGEHYFPSDEYEHQPDQRLQHPYRLYYIRPSHSNSHHVTFHRVRG